MKRFSSFALLVLLSIIFSGCKNKSEIIIPVHKASQDIFKDFKDLKRCISQAGDTFTARHFADTFYIAGEALNNQVPVYQVITHKLLVSDLQLLIEFQLKARYDSTNLSRLHDELTVKISHLGIQNEMILNNLPKEMVCVKNCQYLESLKLIGQEYISVLTMRSPTYPVLYYSLSNGGKLIGFKCSHNLQYLWID
ncbi:MAG: hypothetical protein ACK4EX_05635 [Thermaurantimonas sp.]|uniref:hypothetical protein n=1 Tax=Thermaurantimonas sp. TaxID=2681568 RepID=UPI00391BA5AF